MGLTLLAVGGPRHGEQLPVMEVGYRLAVPVMPPLQAAAVGPQQYCIHGAVIRSKSDGDQHRVSAAAIAEWFAPTISAVYYEQRIVADRAVYVYVG